MMRPEARTGSNWHEARHGISFDLRGRRSPPSRVMVILSKIERDCTLKGVK